MIVRAMQWRDVSIYGEEVYIYSGIGNKLIGLDDWKRSLSQKKLTHRVNSFEFLIFVEFSLIDLRS